MPIEFRCVKCQTLLRTPDDTAGRPAVCPKCGAGMEVPYVSAPTERNPYVAPEDISTRPAASSSTADQMAITSFILGIVSVCFSCCCLIGLPAGGAGIVVGIQGLSSRHRALAIAGIVLSSLGVLASVLASVANLLTDGGALRAVFGSP